MSAPARLPEFLLTAFVVIAIPGPSVLFTVSRGVALGRRAALLSVLGNTGGLAVQGALLAAGLGAVVVTSAALFTIVKLVGAAYLVVLGVRAFRARKRLAEVLDVGLERREAGRIVREGFFVGATNPKGLVLFTAILPQFIDAGQGHVGFQIALMSACLVTVALLSDSVWALISGTARGWLAGRSRRLEMLGAGGGLTMIGLGVALAATGRPHAAVSR